LLSFFEENIKKYYICCVNKSCIHGKNCFADRSKILLDTNQKIILMDHQNNFVETLKIMSDAAKNFDILTYWFERST